MSAGAKMMENEMGGLFKKIRKAIHKVDPVSKAIDKKIGNVDKKKSSATPSATTSASAGGSGPRTADMGKPQKATYGGNTSGGSSAMDTSRKLTAGARSGVGRLQKQNLK